MKNYRCHECGKLYDPVKKDLCPACGAAPAPGLLSTIERRRSAAEHLREERGNSAADCHEDDAWTGSYGAQVHSHAAHFTPNTAPRTRQPASPERQTASRPAQARLAANRGRQQSKPWAFLVVFFLPFIIFLLAILVMALQQSIFSIFP